MQADRRDVPAERLQRQRMVARRQLELLEADRFGHVSRTRNALRGVVLLGSNVQPDRVLTKPFVLTVLAEFATCMSIGMLLVILPVYANDELGVGSFGVALVIGAVSPMILVSQPIAGRIGDRRGRRILDRRGRADRSGERRRVRTRELARAPDRVSALHGARGGDGPRRRGDDGHRPRAGETPRRGAEPLQPGPLGRARARSAPRRARSRRPIASSRSGSSPRASASSPRRSGRCSRRRRPNARRRDRTYTDRPSGGRRPRARSRAHRLRIRGARHVRGAVRAPARDGRCGRGLPRLLGRRRRDANRRPPGAGRLGPKRASGTALLLISTGLLVIGFWNAPAGLYAGTVVLAFGQALAFPALMTLAVSGVPATERSSVVGTFTAFTELGFAIGALTSRRDRLGGRLRRRLRRVRRRPAARRTPADAARRPARGRRGRRRLVRATLRRARRGDEVAVPARSSPSARARASRSRRRRGRTAASSRAPTRSCRAATRGSSPRTGTPSRDRVARARRGGARGTRCAAGRRRCRSGDRRRTRRRSR